MDNGTILIAILIVQFLILLILRELVCWYLKTNRIVTLLEAVLVSLQKRDRLPGGSEPDSPTANLAR